MATCDSPAAGWLGRRSRNRSAKPRRFPLILELRGRYAGPDGWLAELALSLSTLCAETEAAMPSGRAFLRLPCCGPFTEEEATKNSCSTTALDSWAASCVTWQPARRFIVRGD